MKTKKLFLISLLAAFGTIAQAQIVSSRSDQVITIEQPKPVKPKKPRTFKWNIRAGYSYDMMTGSDYFSGTSGFDASFGISMPFKNERLFWGVDLGCMSYGAKAKDFSRKLFSPVVYLNPLIGYKFPLGKKMSLNLYGGPYVGYSFEVEDIYYIDYISQDYTDAEGCSHACHDEHHFNGEIEGIDAGINLGVEFFVSKNVFFDLHVRKGFLHSGEFDYDIYHQDSYYDKYGEYHSDWNYPIDERGNMSALKIVFGIGVQF